MMMIKWWTKEGTLHKIVTLCDLSQCTISFGQRFTGFQISWHEKKIERLSWVKNWLTKMEFKHVYYQKIVIVLEMVWVKKLIDKNEDWACLLSENSLIQLFWKYRSLLLLANSVQKSSKDKNKFLLLVSIYKFSDNFLARVKWILKWWFRLWCFK